MVEEERQIYKVDVKLMLDGYMYVEADGTEDAFKRTDDLANPDNMVITDHHIIDISINKEVDRADMFKDALNGYIKSIAKVHGVDVETLETPLEEFLLRITRIMKVVPPSGIPL